MPPNRKISFSIEDGATASLQLAVHEPIKLVETTLLVQQQSFQEKEHQLLQQELTSVGTTTHAAAVADYWDWDTFANKNIDKDDVQNENESSLFECFFSIHFIESKLIQEAAERLQAKENETVVVISVTVENSSSESSYWDMPPTDEHAALVSLLLGNNQPQKKLSCHHHHRPLKKHHYAAPTGMDVNAYWRNDSNNQDEYWNDPSHSHYLTVKKSATSQSKTTTPTTRPVATMTPPPHHHHAAAPTVDLDTMISYWDEAPAASATIDVAAYWADPASSHDKLGYWDWPIHVVLSLCFDKEEPMQEEGLQSPGCSVTQNDSYWLF